MKEVYYYRCIIVNDFDSYKTTKSLKRLYTFESDFVIEPEAKCMALVGPSNRPMKVIVVEQTTKPPFDCKPIISAL